MNNNGPGGQIIEYEDEPQKKDEHQKYHKKSEFDETQPFLSFLDAHLMPAGLDDDFEKPLLNEFLQYQNYELTISPRIVQDLIQNEGEYMMCQIAGVETVRVISGVFK